MEAPNIWLKVCRDHSVTWKRNLFFVFLFKKKNKQSEGRGTRCDRIHITDRSNATILFSKESARSTLNPAAHFAFRTRLIQPRQSKTKQNITVTLKCFLKTYSNTVASLCALSPSSHPLQWEDVLQPAMATAVSSPRTAPLVRFSWLKQKSHFQFPEPLLLPTTPPYMTWQEGKKTHRQPYLHCSAFVDISQTLGET